MKRNSPLERRGEDKRGGEGRRGEGSGGKGWGGMRRAAGSWLRDPEALQGSLRCSSRFWSSEWMQGCLGF